MMRVVCFSGHFEARAVIACMQADPSSLRLKR